MRKTRKIIISVVVSILVVGLGILGYYHYFYDADSLNLVEKEWLNSHKNSVISINVPGELNIFGKSGKGVFFEFLESLEKNNELKLNKDVIDPKTNESLGFTINKNITKDDLLIFKDHYVIVGKSYTSINNLNDLIGKNIGALANDINRFNTNYNLNMTFTTIENKDAMVNSLTENKVDYLLIPLNEYLDEILSNNLIILYHIDDITNYYYIKLGDDKTLNSIITKQYHKWINSGYTESFNNNLSNLFIDNLNISQVELDSITSKNYTYGFTNSTPYQTLSSSKYGGKVIAYLENFSKFSGVDFTYTKFRNNNELVKAFEKGKIDLLFNNTSYDIKGTTINSNINNNYVIISPLKNSFKVSSISDLNNIEIYIIKDSLLGAKISQNKNINIKQVGNERELLKAVRHNQIIALDKLSYEYLKNTKIKNYQVVFEDNYENYDFKYKKENDTFNKLFNAYTGYLSDYDMTNEGLLTYRSAESNGNLISSVAKYILLVIAISIVIAALIIASRKNVKLKSKKIRKDEKLKFVDMLTALKNRNYLNERIDVWNQNTIYPQAIIVVDLNNIKYLNDTFGHEEGDKQIMAAANILHQTQLDNTEIMRTDGNEFMIYMVGYNEKQVVNYLKKLVKEFNELPYEYGAAFGFSMIVDDLKLIDDAINEATIQMRENKEIENEKSEEQN